MKKIIAFIPSWVLYFVGDVVSRTPLFKREGGWRVYNWSMATSLEIQEWGELSKPWEKPN